MILQNVFFLFFLSFGKPDYMDMKKQLKYSVKLMMKSHQNLTSFLDLSKNLLLTAMPLLRKRVWKLSLHMLKMQLQQGSECFHLLILFPYAIADQLFKISISLKIDTLYKVF